MAIQIPNGLCQFALPNRSRTLLANRQAWIGVVSSKLVQASIILAMACAPSRWISMGSADPPREGGVELTISFPQAESFESLAALKLQPPDPSPATDVSEEDGEIDVERHESAPDSALDIEKAKSGIASRPLPPDEIVDANNSLTGTLPRRAETQPTKLELDTTAVDRSPARAGNSPSTVADSAALDAVVVPAEETAGVDALAVPRSQVNIEPTYPAELLAQRIGGVVKLKVTISAKGTVLRLKVHESSGHDRLDRAAVEAVQTWQFVPARKGTRAIDSTLIVPVRFRIAD